MRKGREKDCGRFSVFKGREARLNRAIFHILALKGPQTIYDIHKEAQRLLRCTRYASVNKRVRLLEGSGYIRKTGIKRTRAGFPASLYELTIKAYLATLLDFINLDELVMRADEGAAQIVLATILGTDQLN